MSSNIKEYKCPQCGGVLNFDSFSQKLKCPYCGSEFDVDTVEQLNEATKETVNNDIKWDFTNDQNNEDNEGNHLRQYVCEACGGEIITDETTAASNCPYCDNPVVMLDQVNGLYKPDLVIPFKLDKKSAKAEFAKHLQGKPLVPKAFKSDSHIDEIKGVYVPFWLFDADVQAKASFSASNSQSWSDGDYNYVKTDYYQLYRDGTLGFDDVPADASTKVDQAMMESIEPFDMDQAVDFKTAYLAGFFADKYDISANDGATTVNERIRNSANSAIAATVLGFENVMPNSINIQVLKEQVKYCLLPVWLLTTKYSGKTYLFAMNGQTGKFVGDLPTDKGSYAKYFLTIMIIVAVVLFAIVFIAEGMGI